MTDQATSKDALQTHEELVSQPSFTPRYTKYVIWMLVCTFTLNLIDRQVLNILAEPIKKELSLADWQIGLMSGLAFASFYAVLGIPIARLAERRSRPKIIAMSLVVWSGFSSLCGAASSFWTLALCRVGVGIGEAGCTPASQSLIADYVSREKRASAFAIYFLGAPIGAFLGLAIGGLLVEPLGWRLVFVVTGLPGILIGFVVWTTIREPREVVRNRVQAPTGPSISLRETITYLRNCRTFKWLTLAATSKAMISFGQGPFLASFFLRNHGTELEQLAVFIDVNYHVDLGKMGLIGLILGIMTGLFGAIGSLVGGLVADRAAKRRFSAQLTFPTIASTALVPIYIAAITINSMVASILLFCTAYFLAAVWYGPLYAIAQSVVPIQMRATSAAVLLLSINLLGVGLGPLIVGASSDFFNHSGLGPAGGIRAGLLCLVGLGLLAAFAFAMARASTTNDLVQE